MHLKRLEASRYLAPLREGGSMPGLVEADGGHWVVKFVGAGQGARALIAEIIVGEVARAIGLPMPELALLDLAEDFGRNEGDPEIRDLLRASAGLNVGMRYLDGALNFDPNAASDLVTPELAADIVWLDTFTLNIDRTVRNPNMMVQDEQLWLIDHGAALYFHHQWDRVSSDSIVRPFPATKQHVLLPHAASITDAHERAVARLDDVLPQIADALPDTLLMHAPLGMSPPFDTPQENRQAYVDALTRRLHSGAFATAAETARQETS